MQDAEEEPAADKKQPPLHPWYFSLLSLSPTSLGSLLLSSINKLFSNRT